jgi:hypothetical protein
MASRALLVVVGVRSYTLAVVIPDIQRVAFDAFREGHPSVIDPSIDALAAERG